MSVKTKALHFSAFASAFALAVLGYVHLTHSAAHKTPLRDKIVKTKKLQTPATIKIRMLEEAEVTADNTYTLEATIKASKAMQNVQWHWNAPTELAFLDRHQGDGLNLKANEEIKMTMRFRQGDNDNKRVRFVMKDATTGATLGRGSYNTTQQRAIAEENKELLERQETYLEENPHSILDEKDPKHFH